MSENFESALADALARIERGEAAADVVVGASSHSGRLAAHLGLSAALLAEDPRVTGASRGRQHLLTLVSSAKQPKGGLTTMGNLISNGLRAIGGLAVVGAAMLALVHFSGNLDVEFGGSEASANSTFACLDQVLGPWAPPTDIFDIDDLIAARAAVANQDIAPQFDRDGDGDVDLDDIMIYVQELKACLASSYTLS